MMYALNREIEHYDMPQIRMIVRAAEENDYTFPSIVAGIVNSDAFRLQGPEEPLTREASMGSDAVLTP